MSNINLSIKFKLDSFEKVIKNIKAVDNILFLVGEKSKKELSDNWLSGHGGDGKAWQGYGPRLSKDYEFKKAVGFKMGGLYHSGDPIPNMHLTGQMQRSITPTKSGKNEVTLEFVGKAQNKKASVNHFYRPNMFVLSELFKNKMGMIIRKFIFPF